MKIISLTQGKCAAIDDCDFDAINGFSWRCRKKTTRYKTYYQAYRIDENGTQITMHKQIAMIMGVSELDHIDFDQLNNQRSNLREASRCQNQSHRRKFGGNLTSRFKGVSFDVRSNRWRSVIYSNRKQIHLGMFKSETDAAIAYNNAAKDIYKDFAVLNNVLAQ